MRTHEVLFSSQAQTQLAEMEDYIAEAASPAIAAAYVGSIIDYCRSLSVFPYRGTPRSDIRDGLRITNYRNRTVIAFSVDDSAVQILGIFHGGQDYETLLHDDPSECDS